MTRGERTSEEKVQQYLADAGVRPAKARRLPAIRMFVIEYLDCRSEPQHIGRMAVNERRAWDQAWDVLRDHGLPSRARFF